MQRVKDDFEDYDIRINSSFASLLLSNLQEIDSTKDHKKAIPIRRLKVLPTEEYLKKYSKLTSYASTILPPGCRYVEPLPNGGKIFIIEEQPQFRTIAMNIKFDIMYEEIKAQNLLSKYEIEGWLDGTSEGRMGERYHKLNLAFPYVIFIVYVSPLTKVEKGYCFLRTKQMLGLSDYLFKIPLSNIAENQAICFGSRLNKDLYNTDAEAVRDTIDIFWTSVFNQDYTYNLKVYNDVSGISNFLEWQYLSREDPMFIYRADWIRYEGTIYDLINNVKERITSTTGRLDNPGLSTYRRFIDIFTKPAKIGEIKTGKIRTRIEPVYYDVTNSYFLNNELRIEIGDSFKNRTGSKKYHIISFIGLKGQEPKTIRLSKNKKLFNFKLNESSKNYILKQLKEERYIKSIEIDGMEIKADDIINYKDNMGNIVHKRVLYIRKTVDGRAEIKLGTRYFLAQNLPSPLQKSNIGKPEIYGINLEKGIEYSYFHASASKTIINKVERCTFDAIDVGLNNELIYRFKSLESGRDSSSIIVRMSYEDTSYRQRIYPKLSDTLLCQNSLIISVGRLLRKFIDYDNDGNETSAKVYKSPTHYNMGINTTHEIADPRQVHNLIKNEGKTFEIDTHFGILKFEIGDLVVVANWKNPLSILDIRRIEGFNLEDKTGSTELSFILADKTGNLTKELYVFKDTIRIGYIRKIITRFEGLSSGMKIMANLGRISNFPKKDTNIIVGIITDGPHPMVLCSNGCTLWYQDIIDNFKQIPIGSSEWAAREHATLDPKKIKLQTGDIVIPYYKNSLNDCGYLMVQISHANPLRYHPLTSYRTSYDNYSSEGDNKAFQQESILDCIPNPRVSKPKQAAEGYVAGVPNFHGGIVLNDKSKFLYINDPRSFI